MKWLVLLCGILQISGYAVASEDGRFSVDIPPYCSTLSPQKAFEDPNCMRDRRDDEWHNLLEIVDEAEVKQGQRGSIFKKNIRIILTGLSDNPDKSSVVLKDAKQSFSSDFRYFGLYGLVGKIRVSVLISGYESVYVDLDLQRSGDIYTVQVPPKNSSWKLFQDPPTLARMTVHAMPKNGIY